MSDQARFSYSQLKGVISQWNVNPTNCEKIRSGLVNLNWLVTSPKGKYILQCPLWQKQRNKILFMFRFLRYLKQKGFPYQVPIPLLTKRKGVFVGYGGEVFWFYRYIDGTFVKRPNTANMKQIGKLIAKCHKIIEKSNLVMGTERTDINSKKPVLGLDRELRAKKSTAMKKKTKYDTAFLNAVETYERLYRKIDLGDYYKVKTYPVHRDITPPNVVWRNGKVVGLIDFDNVGNEKDTLIMDFVSAVQDWCIDKKSNYKMNLRLVRAMLDGYMSVRRFSDWEISLIPYLLIIANAGSLDFLYWKLGDNPRHLRPHNIDLLAKSALWAFENREKIVDSLTK